MKSFGSKNVSESCWCQQSCGLWSIGNVDDRVHGVEHFEVDNSINSNSDRVFGQNLLRRNIKGDSSEVNSDNVVKTWENKEQSWTNSSTFLDLAKSEDDSSLIFLRINVLPSESWISLKFCFSPEPASKWQTERRGRWCKLTTWTEGRGRLIHNCQDNFLHPPPQFQEYGLSHHQIYLNGILKK